jgi:hypothetical protein
MRQPRFTCPATSRDAKPWSSGLVDNTHSQLWCRPDEARSGAGATRSPVSHRSAVLELILATFVALEPGQPPVSVASNFAAKVIPGQADEIHVHVMTPAPLLSCRVWDQSD